MKYCADCKWYYPPSSALVPHLGWCGCPELLNIVTKKEVLAQAARECKIDLGSARYVSARIARQIRFVQSKGLGYGRQVPGFCRINPFCGMNAQYYEAKQ
jgi:hypothetical protein